MTQDDLNAIDEEEELLPLGDTLHFQVNHARGCCVHMVHFFLQHSENLGSAWVALLTLDRPS